MKIPTILYFSYDFYMIVDSDKSTILKNIASFFSNTINVYGKVQGDNFSFIHSRNLVNISEQTSFYYIYGNVLESKDKMIVMLKARINKHFRWLIYLSCLSGLLFYPTMYVVLKEDDFFQSSNTFLIVSIVFPLIFYIMLQIDYRYRLFRIKEDFIKIKNKSEIMKMKS